MFANLLSLKKYGPLQSQDNIPLPQLGPTPTSLHGEIIPDGYNLRVRKYWNFLCYFLHGFLVALHLILLVVATSDHAEHRIDIPYVNPTWTTRLSAGLQVFYTLYAALLVFVTQRLMVSAIFSNSKKLTQIHDICGAWAGLGAALSVLWQQTKVASSVLSIVLVTVYFSCISALHVTSSTLMQFRPSNHTTTGIFPVLSTWPNASVDLASLDWMAVTPLVPFLQNFYPNRTFGLDNNTLYDTPYVGFLTGRVHATTLNANCGLLTNISINASENNTWNVNASMSGLDPISITVSYLPLLDEIWFSPSIECLEPICSTFILYLISAEIEADDTSGGINHVYINGTYYSPSGTTPNFSSPIYFVACSLNATNHTITLDSSGYPLGSGKEPANAAWSAFSPAGDPNLTSAISYAMKSANSLSSSPYCQPIMSDPALWANITVLNAYTRSALGMGVSPCYGVPDAQYTSSPSLLTRSQLESAVAQITAEFIWLAGQLGKPAGGFDRQKIEYPMLMTEWSYKLNINILPVIFALCASVILLVLVVYVLWGRPMTVVSGDGVLEIMWFGSRSRVLRDQLSGVKTPSLDVLRASAMFETIFWARAAYGGEENNDLYSAATLRNQNTHSRSFETLGLSESESRNSRSTSNISRTRHWCYALHVVLVGLHVALIILLVHHPETSIVILHESDTMTIGLSALLQAIYTLYSALLVFLMQRLALFKIVSERRQLTTVHDVSKAWTGIGAAIHMLWQQRKGPGSSSTREILAVGIYLIMMLVLHVTSSSIMQWQWNPVSLRVDVNVQTNLAMPDSTMNISQLGWTEIFPIVRLIQDAGLFTLGLSNTTLSDVQQWDDTTVTGLINATTLTAQCGLVPNLTVSYQNSEEGYQINFQNGTNYGSFLESPIWKDIVHAIVPNAECIACAQTLFYLVTTELDVDESVQDPVVVGLNWTYMPSGGNSQTSTTLTYIAACSLSAQTILALPSDPLGDQALPSTNTSWSLWSPGNATNLSLGMAAALSNDAAVSLPVFYQGNYLANFTNMDSYIMSLLGLNLTYANETSASQSSANPSVALSPWQLENAVARTAAAFLWTAGQVGESGGGFQRSVGETQGMYLASPWRLHLNTIPVLFASIASFVSLILAVIIIGKGPSGERPVSISGTSVLECLWLEAQSEQLHSRLQTVEAPHLDALRAAGMFDIRLGDIGRPGHAEVERPILESVDG